MKKSIAIIVSVLAILYGFATFIKSPSYALMLGERELYLKLKSNRIAAERCDMGAAFEEKKWEACFDREQALALTELKR